MANTFSNLYSRIPLKYNVGDGSVTYEWEYLVGGYFFFQVYNIPQFLANTDSVFQQKIQALCTSVTLPDITLEHTEKPGLGGLHVTVPTKVAMNATFDIKFVEIVSDPNAGDKPVVYALSKWVSTIRDFQTGIAQVLSQYKGNAVLIATDPGIQNVVFAVKLIGIFPTSVPLSNYTADVTANDLVEYTVPFTLDRILLVDAASDPQANDLLSLAQEWRDNNFLIL